MTSGSTSRQSSAIPTTPPRLRQRQLSLILLSKSKVCACIISLTNAAAYQIVLIVQCYAIGSSDNPVASAEYGAGCTYYMRY